VPDVEIEAMGALSSALEGLDQQQRSRVLRWAAERFAVTLPDAGKASRPARNGGRGGTAHEDEDDLDGEGEAKGEEEREDAGNGSAGNGDSFEYFAELYDACDPTSTGEKALVGAYWVQVLTGKSTWSSFEVNKILKDLGHGDSTINRTFSNLMGQKPAKVLQVRRSGSTRQARKTYKLTAEGIKSVKAMMRS
jgi:hypothetical protein